MIRIVGAIEALEWRRCIVPKASDPAALPAEPAVLHAVRYKKAFEKYLFDTGLEDDMRRRFTLGPKQASLIVHVAMESLASGHASGSTTHSDRVPVRPTWEEFETERVQLESQPDSAESVDAPTASWSAIWLAGLVFLYIVHLMMPPTNPVLDSTDQWIDIIGGMLGNLLMFALVFVWFRRTRRWIIVGACGLGLLQLLLLT